MIDLHPTKCNICGGKVIYVSNAEIYGRQYGSGFCYLCTNCRAYVGTHKPYPRNAMGILADEEMRQLKMKAHSLFDKKWSNHKERSRCYKELAKQLGINSEECHFGWMSKETLLKAISLLSV